MKASNPNSTLLKITLLLTSTLTVMAGATIAPSLPEMQGHFASEENAAFLVRLVLTMPALFIVIGAPIVGIMVDKFGRKPVLAGAALLYGLAGTSGFILNTLGSILIGRAFLGLAVAGIMTSVTTLIADYYPGQARANFMGLQAAFMGFGGVLFLSLGGYLADQNWRSPFLIYLFSLILLPFITKALFEPSRKIKNTSGEQQEISNKFPIKNILLIYGIASISQIVFYLIPVQLPFYLKTLANATAGQSGLAIAFCTLFSACASFVYGKLKARFSFLTIAILDFILLGCGYCIIGLAPNYPLVLLGLGIAGMGLGLLMPNLNVWTSSITTDAVRGRALGGLTSFFFVGQFLSPIIAQPITQRLGRLAMVYESAGLLLLALSVVLFIFGKQLVQQPPAKPGNSQS
jgi:MFS family permease